MSGEEWFTNEFNKGASQVFKNSDIQSFIDADEYYTDLRKEVEATIRGDFICWIGFDGGGDSPMPSQLNNEQVKKFPPRAGLSSDKKWLDLLTEASDSRGVNIRVLLNLHPSPKPPDKYKYANFNLVERLNSLKNCCAINDFRYLYMNGTHHQKLVLVYNKKKGLMAFTGTCDIESGRIVQKWCEVQCKIMGDAAAELYQVFQRRWSEHSSIFLRIGSVNSYLPNVSQLKCTAPQSGNFLIQVATTYGNPKRANPFYRLLPRFSCPRNQVVHGPHRIELSTEVISIFLSPHVMKIGNSFFDETQLGSTALIDEALKQSNTYSFAPNGHTGIYHLIKTAIANTKKFIYMEDQYLVCDEKMGSLDSLLNLLIQKVKSTEFKKIIIFCTRIDDINDEFQGTGWKHRNNFISSLIAAAQDKVEVCQYKTKGSVNCSGNSWSSICYIHSKTWIFDDEYLITGSANCNRRGYSHDSELDIGIYDQNKMFVKDMRIKLWQKRLNVEGIIRSPLSDNELNDFLSASKYWEAPNMWGLPIENSKKIPFSPVKYPDLNINTYKALITGQTGWLVAWDDFVDKVKMDGMWNFVVDPEGTGPTTDL
jgi:phosphatidylserine/phosphatidylglycerophosphate/cardiolipin synthase-like enzyme